jgi:serine/threonine protein kinase
MEKHRDRASYVALKFIGDALRGSAEARIALQRECSRARIVSHLNIIRVFRFGCDETSDTYYVTMEWLRGRSLEQLIGEHPAIRVAAGGADHRTTLHRTQLCARARNSAFGYQA